MSTKSEKAHAWKPKASKPTVRRPRGASAKSAKGNPPVGHGRYLWKDDKDFANFMAILEQNSKE